ncbi:MAG: DUF1549 domain-containing protein [Acidobacteria bacterium]|nr:DUF1549 domain-containing protein [Acidobacteriota bacterium]
MRLLKPLVPLLGMVCLAATLDKDDAWVAPRKNYWAFKAPVRAEAPVFDDAAGKAWVKTPVDAFVLEALRAKGLEPSQPLEKAKLLRRVTLDLTGLPPTPEDLDAFLKDTKPGAYERVVERLLASPRYAERWATKWLDVVRYADTNGYELDAERTHAWRYRDYVIRAFQTDKPYDRFVMEQIAGDELWPGDKDALVATGFHRAGPIHLVGGNQDEEMNRQEVLTEMTGALGNVFLGMSVGCARCHNHKFDPIPQADYYKLQAVLAATEFDEISIASKEEHAKYDAAVMAHAERVKPVKEAIAAIEKPYRERLKAEKKAKLGAEFVAALEVAKDKRNEEQERLAKEANAQLSVSWDEVLAVLTPEDRATRAGWRKKLHALEREEPEPPAHAYAVKNAAMAPVSFVLKVGDYKMKQQPVLPGFLRVVNDAGAPVEPVGRRSALAKWLVSEENPLAARVMVNRIWQARMGVGIVATPNDFGVLGQRPSNQKLLDWLATEFVAKGWSVRTMDRMLVTSSVYRQATAHDAKKAEVDPQNKLMWRMNRRRLDAEFLRDGALAVAGVLNTRMFGRPMKVPIEPEVYDLIFTEGEPDNLWPVELEEKDHFRRSLYLLNKRTVRLPMMANFDQPDAMTSCPVRPVSTHALQALSLLNSDTMRGAGRQLAARLEKECGGDAACRVRRAYVLALAREPEAAELEEARAFVGGGGAWEDFALAMVNRNEFVYVP